MARVLGLLRWLHRGLMAPWDPAIARSLAILLIVVLSGTAGYAWIEGWDPWHALFFTIITITTVGFSDYGLTTLGEKFTILVMVGGIGTVSYAASSLVQRTIAHGLKPEKRMLQRIKTLSGHYIVCGFGRMGRRVTRQLVAADVAFVVVDTDEKLVAQARELGMIAIEGDATEDGTLENAGLERACSLAAITSSDAVNAMICLTAHAIAPELRIIARAEDEDSIRKMTRAGAERVLSPSSHGADGIAQTLLRPDAARVLFGDGGIDSALAFGEIAVDNGSPFAGRTLREIGATTPSIVFVASTSAEGEIEMRPRADRSLSAGDVLIVAGTNAEIRELRMQERLAA
ncbi:MAG: potassium channel protein [Planctomycetota bacterium]